MCRPERTWCDVIEKSRRCGLDRRRYTVGPQSLAHPGAGRSKTQGVAQGYGSGHRLRPHPELSELLVRAIVGCVLGDRVLRPSP